jgi:hypothetical protein
MRSSSSFSKSGCALAVAAAFYGALTLVACNGDDNSGDGGSPDSATPDSAAPDVTTTDAPSGDTSTDAPADTGSDATANDAGADADADADAGPTVETTNGAVGEILLDQSTLIGSFYQAGKVVKWTGTPECEAEIRLASQALIGAGGMTITGGLIGMTGGVTPSPLVVQPQADPKQYLYFTGDFGDGTALFYDGTATTMFSFATAGSATFAALTPAVGVQAPKITTMITVSAPAAPAAPPLVIAKTSDFTVTWTAPAAGNAQQIIVRLENGTSAASHATITCGFPASAGTGTIPKQLFDGILAATAGTSILGGTLLIGPGERKVTTLGSGETVVTQAWAPVGATTFQTVSADIK